MKIETANLERRELLDLISAFVPAPVALISTIGQDGIYNAAPFCFYTPVCVKPLMICIVCGLRQGQKIDTLRNIEFSHDFVVNFVDETIIERAIQASATYPSEVDEIKEVGLTAITSEKVKSPRIAESKASLECQLVQKLEILEELREGVGFRSIIFGEVVLAHIKDEVCVGGQIDPSRLGAVYRVGTDLYGKTGDIFAIKVADYKFE